MTRFAIHSNKVVTQGAVISAFVLVEDGIITAVADKLPQGLDVEITDVHDKILMPGVIDPHVHINEPGRTNWEGFDTATKAALAGGITTLVDMPLNSSPVTTTVQAFDAKLLSTHGQLHTNCGFWGGVIPGNEMEIEGLIHKGVLGFKAFLVHSGIDEFANATEEDLRKAMPVIARSNLPLLVHCELSGTLNQLPDDGRSYRHYLASRPKYWEDDAIALMIRLCAEFNCRTHIVHLSSADSIAQIAAAKHQGLPLTVETGQHYLYFHAEGIGDGQTAFKCAPPIREKENSDRLWEALRDGVIDFVATDHSPAPPDMKQMESGDFMKAWGGISSLQFALPVLWTVAKRNGGTLTELAAWLCEHPAKLIGKENSKGKIAVGFDADFVIWDAEKDFTVSPEMIFHKHKITPYIGERLTGVVEETWLQGLKVFKNGKFIHLNMGKIMLPS